MKSTRQGTLKYGRFQSYKIVGSRPIVLTEIEIEILKILYFDKWLFLLLKLIN